MPSKKKKYNARFPPARIKKIMQKDEDVGKVAAAVPVIISRALELFIDSLMEKTAAITKAKNAKTLSASHIKQAIHSEKTFDFLRDLVQNVPDHQAEEDIDTAGPSGIAPPEKKAKIVRPKKEGGRGPGRPRKVKVEEAKASVSGSDEETETDEEQRSDCDTGTSETDTSSRPHTSQSQPAPEPHDPQSRLPLLTQIPVPAQFPPVSHSMVPPQQQQQNLHNEQQHHIQQQYVQQSQQQQMVQMQSPSFPMSNMQFSHFPYNMGQAQMNMVPYISPQVGATGQPFTAPAMPGQAAMPYSPGFMPDQTHRFMAPQMQSNGPMLNMVSAPSVLSNSPHTIQHSPGATAQTSQMGDTNVPLDMSLSGKTRSQENNSAHFANSPVPQSPRSPSRTASQRETPPQIYSQPRQLSPTPQGNIATDQAAVRNRTVSPSDHSRTSPSAHSVSPGSQNMVSSVGHNMPSPGRHTNMNMGYQAMQHLQAMPFNQANSPGHMTYSSMAPALQQNMSNTGYGDMMNPNFVPPGHSFTQQLNAASAYETGHLHPHMLTRNQTTNSTTVTNHSHPNVDQANNGRDLSVKTDNHGRGAGGGRRTPVKDSVVSNANISVVTNAAASKSTSSEIESKTVSFPGLANIMKHQQPAKVAKADTDDDDYDS